MNMKPEWKRKYGLLREYIESNPEIVINTSEVSIPEAFRDRFYELFDEIRDAYVAPVYSSLPFEMEALRDNYIRAEKEATEALGIEGVDLPVDLSSFLSDPKTGMQRWLYNRMFEMIQGKITEEAFERMAGFDLYAGAEAMFKMGYGLWAFLTIVLLLEPDRVFAVALDQDNEPVPGDLKRIALGRQFHDTVKRIPEFVVHSKRLDRFVALKTPLAREVSAYYVPFEIPKKTMRDNTGDTSSVLDARVVFLSLLPDPESIPVYIEMHTGKTTSPDLIVEFLTRQNISDSDAVSQVQNRAALMKPRLGTSVVIIDPGNETNAAGPGGEIETFAAGLETSKLLPVIDRLVS